MPICTKCHTERPDNQYEKYWHSTFQKFYTRKICTPCQREVAKLYKRNKRLEKKNSLIIQSNVENEEVLTNEKITQPMAPELIYEAFKNNRQMYSEERKSDLYHFMVAMGWTYSIENNIYYNRIILESKAEERNKENC